MKTQISQPRLGFTLIELLVVIGVIAVLSSILIPVLGEAKSKARAIKCISNKKQLVNAWHLYSTDNDGWLILNGETNVSVERIPAEKNFWPDPWVSGRITFGQHSSNTNIQELAHPNLALFSKYIPYSAVDVYRCPEDRYLSQDQKKLGWSKRMRNVTMNWYLGDQPGSARGSFSWEKEAFGALVFRRYYQVKNPSKIFVFSDTHPGDVGTPTQRVARGVAADGVRLEWDKIPGALHNGATPIAFTDGHVQNRKWIGPLVKQKVNPENRNSTQQRLQKSAKSSWENKKDILWLLSKSTQYKYNINEKKNHL